jgi:hypothetical protein
LARPASLVISRPNGSTTPAVTSKTVKDFIADRYEESRFEVEPIGKNGSFKVFVEALTPASSRKHCAEILLMAKKGLKDSFGLNVFYDNPFFLREIRSEVLRFTASMLQDQGLKLRGKPVVKRDMLVLDGLTMFPEYLVPSNEALWTPAFQTLGDMLRSNRDPSFDPKQPIVTSTPLAQALMEDLFVASKGLIFPKPPTQPRSFSTGGFGRP